MLLPFFLIMARIHQNGCRAHVGKVGQLPCIILWRNCFVRHKMPFHANFVVPGCPNRKDHCKWGLFPSEEDVQGRNVYVKRSLCESTLDKVGCSNTTPSCKSVSFHWLPKDLGARAVLTKKWLAKIPREDTRLTPNSYICGIHFPTGHLDEDNDSPSIFLGKPVVSKRYTRASTKGIFM